MVNYVNKDNNMELPAACVLARSTFAIWEIRGRRRDRTPFGGDYPHYFLFRSLST